MSKQSINIGEVIDDGTGDYMRKGGIKINSNFEEIYDNLGDSNEIHASGFWQTFAPIDSSENELTLEFGDQISIDASNINIVLYLPNATAPADVGKTVKIRDAYKSWGYGQGFNTVTLNPGLTSNNTIKTKNDSVVFGESYKDIELVYTGTNDWQYVDSKYIDRISNANKATENSVEVTASGLTSPQALYQWDLNTDFDGFIYDAGTVNVFRKGNLLTKGLGSNGLPTIQSDYGSVPTASNPSVIVGTPDGNVDLGIAKLDGKTIKLVQPALENDTIIVKSLLENPGLYSSTYISKSFIIENTDELSEYDGESVIKLDLSTLESVSLYELGMPNTSFFNPGSLKVSINGKLLVGENFIDYNENVENPLKSYDYVVDRETIPGTTTYIYNTIIFSSTGYLTSGDVLTLEWFNNNAGSNLDWEGKGGIEELVTDNFVKSDRYFTVKNKLQYSDTANPGPTTAVVNQASYTTRVANVSDFFDTIYPIGTIYENANNPNNPSDYMGFGVWEPYAEGKVTVGYSNDAQNIFHNNPQIGTPIAGGEFGDESVLLDQTNIPSLATDQSSLSSSSANLATLVINTGCLIDPQTTPETTYLKEEKLTINSTGQLQNEVSILQPSITSYKWVRVA